MSNPIPLTIDGTGPDGAIPVSISGLGGGSIVSWADVTDKPAFIAAGANQTAARTAIGAGTGTSNVVVATTAPAALAAAAAVGTGTTAARADHVHPFPTAANVGAPTVAQYTALEARVAALEAAAA